MPADINAAKRKKTPTTSVGVFARIRLPVQEVKSGAQFKAALLHSFVPYSLQTVVGVAHAFIEIVLFGEAIFFDVSVNRPSPFFLEGLEEVFPLCDQPASEVHEEPVIARANEPAMANVHKIVFRIALVGTTIAAFDVALPSCRFPSRTFIKPGLRLRWSSLCAMRAERTQAFEQE